MPSIRCVPTRQILALGVPFEKDRRPCTVKQGATISVLPSQAGEGEGSCAVATLNMPSKKANSGAEILIVTPNVVVNGGPAQC